MSRDNKTKSARLEDKLTPENKIVIGLKYTIVYYFSDEDNWGCEEFKVSVPIPKGTTAKEFLDRIQGELLTKREFRQTENLWYGGDDLWSNEVLEENSSYILFFRDLNEDGDLLDYINKVRGKIW